MILLLVITFVLIAGPSPSHCQTVMIESVRGLVDQKPSEGPFVETDQGYMVPYQETIPGTNISFEMIPLPGGKFNLGSPESEVGRNTDEGPRVQVQIKPLWFAKCEVNWATYRAYLNQYSQFKELSTRRFRRSESERESAEKGSGNSVLANYLVEDPELDGVTCPTPIYDPSFTFEAGIDDSQPAVTMTQYAAKQFTKWLSGLTERDYRLPSESEWEYAARAGSVTAYSFGDDPALLAEFAWYADNSSEQTHPVGTKKPNAWGLHDLHGNVAEWVLDAYAEDYEAIKELAGTDTDLVVNWPTELYPRSIRGGCWFDDPNKLRSATRMGSNDDDWTLADPNLPVSPWWFTETETLGVGMRVVRPLEPLDQATKQLVWEADFEDLQLDVEDRMAEGRGAKAVANPMLPQAIKELQETAQ